MDTFQKFKDIEILEKQIAHTEKLARADKTKKAEVEVMQKVLKLIQDGVRVSQLSTQLRIVGFDSRDVEEGC